MANVATAQLVLKKHKDIFVISIFDSISRTVIDQMQTIPDPRATGKYTNITTSLVMLKHKD